MAVQGPTGFTPELADVLLRALARFGAALRVAAVGRVERYDPATGLADVAPLQEEPRVGDDGMVAYAPLPVLPGVPVLALGGGGARLRLPVAAGDQALLVFTDLALDEWKAAGGRVAPRTDPRRHSVAGAVAIVGLTDARHPWTGTGDRASLGVDGGTQVEVGPGIVALGAGSAAHPVPLGDNLVQTVAHWIDQAQLACVGPLAPLKVPLAGLVVGLGYVPGAAPDPGAVSVLSDVVKTV